MIKFSKLIIFSCLAAVTLCLVDMAMPLAMGHSFLSFPGLGGLGKVYLAAADFLILFLFFLISCFFLISGNVFMRTAGLWMSMGFFAFYIISWITFFCTSQFIDVEGIRFFFHNFFLLMEFIFQTTRPLLFVFFVIVIFTPLLAGPLYSRWIKACLEQRPEDARTARTGIWILSLAVVTALVLAAGTDRAILQRVLRSDLSPQATLMEDYFMPVMNKPWFEYPSSLVIRWHRQAPLKPAAGIIAKAPVIMIVIESMRSDVLKDARVMPNLYKLKQEGLYFNNSFPASNESDYAWPATMSSEYPLRSARHHYYPEHITYPRVMIYDLLKVYGYQTAIFSAQNEEWGGMRHYLDTGHLDVFFDANTLFAQQHPREHDSLLSRLIVTLAVARKPDDGQVIDHAMQWITGQGGKPFFLAINLQRSHFPYTWPASFHPPYSPYVLDFPAMFAKYPKSKVQIMKNRYDNALAYIDEQIGRLIDLLKKQGLYDQSLIVVTGDHGEAFYERDAACHAADLDAESAHTFLLFKAPGGSFKGIRDDFAQNIDIPPTICHFLGLPPHPAFQGGDLLSDLPFDRRPIFMTVSTPRAKQDAIILGSWKFIKDYTKGREFLFNIEDDFMQDHNLMTAFPQVADSLRSQLMAWRSVQLEYYRNGQEQKEFYPPQIISGSLADRH